MRLSPNLSIQKTLKRLAWLIISLFILINIMAYFHAYKFTHFAAAEVEKTKNPKELGLGGKFKALCLGVNNPKPRNKALPQRPYETITLQSSKQIECWHIKLEQSLGTVIIFHGFSGNKSLMLDKSDAFNAMGYSTFLVDFIGTGGSEGYQTTIGYQEAQDVKVCYEYLQQSKEKNIILFGTSMGAAAILRAADVYQIQPACAILECPFGSMYRTTAARFSHMNVPAFPMAGLLVFWGGLQNGFWAFGHNPQDYARNVNFPTLLLYGEADISVSKEETQEIFRNMKGKKKLYTFPNAGHENYLKRYRNEWESEVSDFLCINH